uniref:Uncharacterized protein n=1 Tax=Odontella aurita TaxID=265563 RepID=A0A7S4N056_9STRA|mmetsp:Transcript_42305/g.128328  ORF Transcript_42305/g.128328 Transcript_42305/m.128328 type:complete len:216 (+) Transcript_42305:288-935(+)
MAGTESICGSVIKSKRGALAMGWSIVVILTFIALLTALIFSIQNNYYAANYADENYADENYDEDENEGNDKNKNKNGMVRAVDIVVSSRAMAFAAVWTAILAGIMAVYGTVVLGVQSLSGKYYWCCSKDVHNTTPLSIGMFIGSLLMFANVTLVCSVLFSEFQVCRHVCSCMKLFSCEREKQIFNLRVLPSPYSPITKRNPPNAGSGLQCIRKTV